MIDDLNICNMKTGILKRLVMCYRYEKEELVNILFRHGKEIDDLMTKQFEVVSRKICEIDNELNRRLNRKHIM
jgi:hypothetical protein